MSDGWRNAGRTLKAVLAYALVPVVISYTIGISANGANIVLQSALPEDSGLRDLDNILLLIAGGAVLCIPVAWVVGPLTFGLDPDSGNRRLLWRQAAIGICIGGGFAAIVGFLFIATRGEDLSDLLLGILFGLGMAVMGAILGGIHALGLRYALLWLGLIGPANATDPRTEW